MGMSLEELSQLGDPDGMEALASELLLRAESIAGIASSLSSQVGQVTFEGPAAAALRANTDERRLRADRIAGELREAANALRGRAADARDRIHEAGLAARRAEDRDP